MSLSSDSVLITGVAGQVGSILADYILENTSLSVIGFMRWNEPLDNLSHLATRINNEDRIRLRYGDVVDFPSLLKAIDEERPAYVSHLAAQSFPKTSFDAPVETLQTNVIGTANLLEAIRAVTARDTSYSPAIHVCSSSEVYGKQKAGTKLSESSAFHGASPYSIGKIGTDFLGQFYGEAYGLRTFVTRMGTHSGRRRSDVFFESTVAKQIAMIEQGLLDPVLKVGNLSSVRTFQDARDAVRAYFLLLSLSAKGGIPPGDIFNIAGNEAFRLDEVVQILLDLSFRNDISVVVDSDRLRPIDADYQMFDNTKLLATIDWKPEIGARDMFEDLLNHWRSQIQSGRVPLSR